ncbi:hypothetical protein [Micromonospora sp. RTGN7]|uniref:hypothetical protein n=1 Tax=Micromonospora sp. RTGN7 TaxID=3016526 RepID=UPI0029FF0850|nr:hypothetical protein [Micromonospora sp. RTGN7]
MEKSRPAAGKRYTDIGEVHDDRGLKHRGDTEAREVPVLAELVAILRAHIDRFGVGADGRLFRSERGNVVASSTYSRVWEEARTLSLTPDRAASPIAGRPYDLRHAGVSFARTATNGGFGRRPAAQVGSSTRKRFRCSDGVFADLRGAPGRIRTCDTRFRNGVRLSPGAAL